MELIVQRILILVCASLLQCVFLFLKISMYYYKNLLQHGNTMQ